VQTRLRVNAPGKVRRAAKIALLAFAAALILTHSNPRAAETADAARIYTRGIEFDYVEWTLRALFVKSETAALGLERYLPADQGQRIVEQYFSQVDEINRLRAGVDAIYADPNIADPQPAAAEKSSRLAQLEKENALLAALSETILQRQVAEAAADMGLSVGGQLIPPLLYRVTPLPMALIISPRDVIRQDADISLQADLSPDQVVALEQRIEEEMNVSALVVNVGGVGIYPTMVLRTTNLSWMIETIAHEWVHNFLTLRPLGLMYMQTPQLRTMNETSASLAGKEIALEVYKRYYPQFVPVEAPQTESAPVDETAETDEPSDELPVFDFSAEMHETRVTADHLLAEGKIEEAEAYMEARRQVFWDNGYQLRRINQAYFAFHGAYADEPGGEAGEDPVGPAVRKLREQSGSLAQFLRRIGWMTSFEALQKAVSDS
jgi:hypothetical protein